MSTAFGTAVCLFAGLPAAAHDSWFAPSATQSRLLALGTGNRFPKHEFAIDSRYLVHSRCRDADGQPIVLAPLVLTPHALLLRPGAAAVTCWVQLQPFDVELTPALVDVYLEEARPDASVRARWADLKSRGLPWIERYTKDAHVVLWGDGIDASTHQRARADDDPVPGLDLRLETRDPVDGGPPRAGTPLEFRLLDHGRPLAGQALQLQSSVGQAGQWTTTDAQGRIRIVAPTPGRWLLRGIEIKPASDRADAWTSRFVTLAFQLRPAQL